MPDSSSARTHSQIANTYAVCPATVSNIVKAYSEKGLDEIIKYHISPNSSAALRKTNGRTEAKLIQMACGSVPEGHSRWTLRLLEKKAWIELNIPISKDTIGRLLKKINFGPISTTTGLSHQKKMQNL